MSSSGGSQTQTLVAQTAHQILHLVLRPGNSVQEAWAQVQQELSQQVQSEVTPQFLQNLEELVLARGLDGQAAVDLVKVVLLKKIKTILDGIIAKYPVSVQREADEALAEVQRALSQPCSPGPPHVAAPAAANAAATSSGSSMVATIANVFLGRDGR